MNRKLIVAVVIAIIAVAGVGVGVGWWYHSDRGRFTTAPVFTGLDRSVSGNELISDHDPAAVLRFDPAFHYLGGQKFILYGVASVEQHFFVETTADDKLKSVYWVQYESYLPGKPYQYDYEDSPLRVTLNGHEFYADTAVIHFDPAIQRQKGTDGAMVRQFLASHGYAYPDDFVYARLVWLVDDSHQKELMIIFIDDLSTYGFTAADLEESGAHAFRRPDIEKAHLARIQDTLSILPLSP
jgi:hypothetical protein